MANELQPHFSNSTQPHGQLNVTPQQQAHRRARPIMRFAQPNEHGPGYERAAPRYEEAVHHTTSHNSHEQSRRANGNAAAAAEHNEAEARLEHERHHKRKATRRMAKALIHDLLCTSGEFVGTFMFLLLSFLGAQSATFNRTGGTDSTITTNSNSDILFIALSFGMSLVVVAWAFFRITGSAFNPAVTIALYLIGGLTLRRTSLVVVAQLLGGIAASAVTKGLAQGPFGVQCALGMSVSKGQAVGYELFTTALLVFTVLMLAAEKSASTFLAPVAIGLALFVGHLASISVTGAGINPSRVFGPQVVSGNFPSNTWTLYVGQIIGSLLATSIYVALKHLDYEEVVSGIDSNEAEQSADPSAGPLRMALSKAVEVLPVPARSGDDDAEVDLEAGEGVSHAGGSSEKVPSADKELHQHE